MKEKYIRIIIFISFSTGDVGFNEMAQLSKRQKVRKQLRLRKAIIIRRRKCKVKKILLWFFKVINIEPVCIFLRKSKRYSVASFFYFSYKRTKIIKLLSLLSAFSLFYFVFCFAPGVLIDSFWCNFIIDFDNCFLL